MALETWLVKVKTAISTSMDSVRSTPSTTPRKQQQLAAGATVKKANVVGVLSFEIAGLMSKLLHLWQSLSDKNIIRLKNECICLEGVRKIVSNDDSVLLGLACAEMAENVRLVAKAVSRLSKKCDDPCLRSFERVFEEFSNTGRDPYNWVLSWKEMDAKVNKKMERLKTATSALYREMEELVILETTDHSHSRKNKQSLQQQQKMKMMVDLQHKILVHRQEVKHLKERSLWNSRSFDTAISLLARSIFTLLARIKLVFGIGSTCVVSLPRSLSASSAAVYPSSDQHDQKKIKNTNSIVSGGPPAMMMSTRSSARRSSKHLDMTMMIKDSSSCSSSSSSTVGGGGFFEEVNSKLMLKPPATTLGASALALHYANLIIVMEKMIRSPQLVGLDARDDLYSMLPNSIRSFLRARLKGVLGFSASDPGLAGDWRDALGKILGWLSPLAHNMIKWQSERSFEHQNNLMPKTNVLLLQTLYFANKDKTEAAITELLVGLNYIWRFEREMNAKALIDQYNSHFNGSTLDLHANSSS